MKRFVLALGVVSILLSSACLVSEGEGSLLDTNPAIHQAGAAGATGEGGSGGAAGGAGTGGSKPAEACDSERYYNSAPCAAGDRCVDGNYVWRCDQGIFHDFQRISAAPLPEGCNPIGAWELHATKQGETKGGGCSPSIPPSLQIALDVDGELLVSTYGQGEFDPAACRLSLRESQSFQNPSEDWSEKWQLSLTFGAQAPSGDYELSGSGFCFFSEKGLLSATQVP